MAKRLWRTLSAFDHPSRSWAPITPIAPLRNTQSPAVVRVSQNQPAQRLSLTSWNIDAFSPRPVARARLILTHILERRPNPPDIIFLQEVSSDVRTSLLDDARVRAAFLATDAEDHASFEGVPFATMALLSTQRFAGGLDPRREGVGIARVARVALPSKYRRDALYVDIVPPTAPGTVFRLINVHLDSLGDTLHHRARQLEILADVLRESGCSGGVIAGDFNAVRPEDGGLLGKNGLVDAWATLHDTVDPGGATWSVGVERRDGLKPGRLDKVAMMGSKVEGMQVLRPGHVDVPRPDGKPFEIPWSDHCGPTCIFTI